MIPKIIHQTFETKNKPVGMAKACESWRVNNHDYVYLFYDASERIDFIKEHFEKPVLTAYDTILPGAFKADLFRYCVLYIRGGVYVDSDTICLTSIDKYISSNDKLVVVRDDPMAKNG